MSKTTLSEDIQSFQNVVKCLLKYNSVGDKDSKEYSASLIGIISYFGSIK